MFIYLLFFCFLLPILSASYGVQSLIILSSILYHSSSIMCNALLSCYWNNYSEFSNLYSHCMYLDVINSNGSLLRFSLNGSVRLSSEQKILILLFRPQLSPKWNDDVRTCDLSIGIPMCYPIVIYIQFFYVHDNGVFNNNSHKQ